MNRPFWVLVVGALAAAVFATLIVIIVGEQVNR